MNTNEVNEVLVQLFSLTISARGVVAICAVAVPIAVLLSALAWRIAGGKFKYRNIT
jgi:hypothetical protein